MTTGFSVARATARRHRCDCSMTSSVTLTEGLALLDAEGDVLGGVLKGSPLPVAHGLPTPKKVAF